MFAGQGWRGYGMRGDTKWLARRNATGSGDDAAAGLSAQLFATTDWESLARDEGRCTTPGVLDGVRLLEKLTLEEEEVISAGQTCRVYTGRWHPQVEQKAKVYGGGTLERLPSDQKEPTQAGDMFRGRAVAGAGIPEGLPPQVFTSVSPDLDLDGKPVALKKLYLQCVSEEDLVELSEEVSNLHLILIIITSSSESSPDPQNLT